MPELNIIKDCFQIVKSKESKIAFMVKFLHYLYKIKSSNFPGMRFLPASIPIYSLIHIFSERNPFTDHSAEIKIWSSVSPTNMDISHVGNHTVSYETKNFTGLLRFFVRKR